MFSPKITTTGDPKPPKTLEKHKKSAFFDVSTRVFITSNQNAHYPKTPKERAKNALSNGASLTPTGTHVIFAIRTQSFKKV